MIKRTYSQIKEVNEKVEKKLNNRSQLQYKGALNNALNEFHVKNDLKSPEISTSKRS
jgi:hypothetical protein